MVRIAHIADVHWRGMSRHDEYREVFSEFSRKVIEQKVQHVYVGGDIFHTKTVGMSPEYIEHIVWWFKELSQYAQLHVTLGNHDGNLTNLSRQDAISPIVSTLDNKNIHLYKQSGVYQFHPGYNWCVFSLFDEANWDKVKPVPGDINIACYHGPVWGAKTESDWLIESGITVDFFKDFEFAMLGDIHKKQYLDFRDSVLEIDEDDLFQYPGAQILK